MFRNAKQFFCYFISFSLLSASVCKSADIYALCEVRKNVGNSVLIREMARSASDLVQCEGKILCLEPSGRRSGFFGITLRDFSSLPKSDEVWNYTVSELNKISQSINLPFDTTSGDPLAPKQIDIIVIDPSAAYAETSTFLAAVIAPADLLLQINRRNAYRSFLRDSSMDCATFNTSTYSLGLPNNGGEILHSQIWVKSDIGTPKILACVRKSLFRAFGLGGIDHFSAQIQSSTAIGMAIPEDLDLAILDILYSLDDGAFSSEENLVRDLNEKFGSSCK